MFTQDGRVAKRLIGPDSEGEKDRLVGTIPTRSTLSRFTVASPLPG